MFYGDRPMTTSFTVSATAPADPDRVWDLLTLPACWPAWAPHMRHVRGEAHGWAPGRVAEGQQLRVDVGIGPGLRLHITEVRSPRSWTMVAATPLIGSVTSTHEVLRRGGRTEVRVTVRADAPGGLAAMALRAYRPLAQHAVRRLVDLAAAERRGAQIARRRMCQPED